MIRAWVGDGAAVREVSAAAAIEAAASGRSPAWIDLEGEEAEAVHTVLEPLHIHPLVLDDMVMEVNRPKVHNYGTYLYLVVHSARWDEDRPTIKEIDLVIGERFLVSCHDGSTRSISSAHTVLPRRPELLVSGPCSLVHFILDVLVDHYLPIMDVVTEEIDGLEEHLFQDAAMVAHGRILRLKRGMSALRRIVGPQRDTVLALTRDEFRAIPAELRPYLRDVYDRLARVNDLLDSFRDEVASLLDLQVAMASNRLNEVIKRLTVIATVGLPLTLITGYYGMNFDFGEYHFRHAWVFAVGLLLLSGLLTWWLLKRNRWL